MWRTVPVRKLESTDAFLVTDLADAPVGVGVVRAAPKVLVDGAELLARATTYAFATFGVQATGVSAGVNAAPDARAAAVAAFLAEVGPALADGSLHLWPGTGVDGGDGLAPVDDVLTARGAVAAARAFGAGGRAAAPGPWVGRLTEAGWDGEVVEGGPDAEADVVFVAGKAGIVDDAVAGTVRAKLLVPLTPVPVTAKAYATLSRAGTVFVPDAVAVAAPLLAVAGGDGDPVGRVAAKAGELAARGVDAWRGMVEQAEAFLGSWQPALPFGRPLA